MGSCLVNQVLHFFQILRKKRGNQRVFQDIVQKEGKMVVNEGDEPYIILWQRPKGEQQWHDKTCTRTAN